MNKIQKGIAAVSVPVLLFMVGWISAHAVDSLDYPTASAFDYENTYWVWILTIALISLYEFMLFKK